MSTLHRSYEPARACTDGPAPGAREFMAWFLGAFADRGGTNLGIYNCRSVRGGSTTSLHGEGRATDFGINPHGAQYGWDLARLLVACSGALGIQCVIWDRQIWSGSYADQGFRPYGGVNPHVDHLHVELSRASARTLTAARVHEVLAGQIGEEGDELTPEEKKRLANVESMLGLLVEQLVVGQGDPADHRTWGWDLWGGGTGQDDGGRSTVVDMLRRSNVETRQAWLTARRALDEAGKARTGVEALSGGVPIPAGASGQPVTFEFTGIARPTAA